MSNLKVLYVCRLFSGFETSIKSEEWSPTGVPTIYKMIDALNASNEHMLKVIFTQKKHDSNLSIPFFKKIQFQKFDSSVLVLSSINLSYLLKFSKFIQELFHIFVIFVHIFKKKYDLLYVDNANIFIATIISRMRLIPVVFRVMGVYPAMRSVAHGKGIKNKFLRWCYASPFSLVICTQDGSGVEPWIRRSINPQTPVKIMINGVSANDLEFNQRHIYDKYSIPNKKFIILFLGKLEEIKGIYDFIDGFNAANNALKNTLHAVIIGSGEEYKNVMHEIKHNHSITLISRVPHNEILQFHDISDIYVSTNRLANLTNANLESMYFGNCMIIPSSQKDTYVDIETDKLLSENAVYRIQYPPSGQQVSDAIVFLYNHPELREELSNNVRDESNMFISSWESRIKKELKLIKNEIT